ncbi:hypothetical protein PVK06_027697 [Gossypium arboreum]|uniref:Uncharacterized protein n=1 Tax=Gossypium arboreum TaxID=29729 RepID=A0ABR0P0Z1_GOSAR|nr:hypothetical protein PVK06_027697 [Gossypium arboreum]
MPKQVGNGKLNTELIQLFAELEDAELIENIHSVVIETDALGEDRFDNNDNSNPKCEDFSDLNLDDVPEDINDKGSVGVNDYAFLVENQSRGIIIRNDLRAHMSIVDPNVTYAFEFPEYPDIIPTKEDPESEELFVGQRFASKNKCVNAIKCYSLKVFVDYRVADSKPTIYVGKC